MNLRGFLTILAASFIAVDAGKIDHDKVEPFPQPEPVTISEKAAVKFKPQLNIVSGCVSFPAVNAAGETSGGLKGNSGNSACDSAPLGSQVYGRAMWYNDVWAIMYAWYFPKGFFIGVASRRFDWASAVVWIDNPDFATPKILGLSTSTIDDDYQTKNPAPDFAILDGTSTLLYHSINEAAGQLWGFSQPCSSCIACMQHFVGYLHSLAARTNHHQHSGEVGKLEQSRPALRGTTPALSSQLLG
ncbi:hypothetical protein PR002_g24864 [Phytophthora rubi]|uniref:Necrosis inducing protein NPP1 type n=1 Tax=Phytophthora rubi TaxID=129364 RepID=A0A6A3I772_9STRA|nr:hypothetical protein PR002_g24864 [Phytophthora rubi]